MPSAKTNPVGENGGNPQIGGLVLGLVFQKQNQTYQCCRFGFQKKTKPKTKPANPLTTKGFPPLGLVFNEKSRTC